MLKGYITRVPLKTNIFKYRALSLQTDISGMESVATAMECSTIAGRNAALLLVNE